MVLVLKDLTLRPVPRHEVLIATAPNTGSQASEPIRVTTGFDGTVDVELRPGNYRALSAQAVELEGQRFTWDIVVIVPPSQIEMTVDLSNDNATAVAAEKSEAPITPEGRVFSECKDGVVTVESDAGHGSGFVVDPSGLVLTNAHVVEGSREVAVDFDNNHRIVAEIVAVDSDNDVAVLRFNPAAFPQVRVLKLALSPGSVSLREGDPVIAIGSPLNQEKIVTRGIVSKVQERAILSDVNINHGNSGGPLLNTAGEVIGITTFKDLDPTGGGVSGVIRIDQAGVALKKARDLCAQKAPPEIRALPPMPDKPFPVDELKKLIQAKEYNPRDYGARTGTFDVQFITPPLKYYLETKSEAEKADIRARRQKKSGGDADADPYSNLKAWRAYLGDYQPVVEVYMLPRLKATGGSIFAAAMSGVSGVLKYRYKSDFDKAELLIDGKEIVPVRRSRFTQAANFVSAAGSAHDVSYAGLYIFPADLLKDLRPDSNVTLVLHDGMKPDHPIPVALDSAILLQINHDMSPAIVK